MGRYSNFQRNTASYLRDFGLKHCPKCKRNLPVSNFANTSRSYCRDCQAMVQREVRDGFAPISHITYEALWEHQNGLCAICNETLDRGKKTHIDHCSKTGQIRGLLCAECNQGIGKLKHNPETLRKAAQYLEDFEQANPPLEI